MPYPDLSNKDYFTDFRKLSELNDTNKYIQLPKIQVLDQTNQKKNKPKPTKSRNSELGTKKTSLVY